MPFWKPLWQIKVMDMIYIHIIGMLACIVWAARRNGQRYQPLWLGMHPAVRLKEQAGWLLPAILASCFVGFAYLYPQPTMIAAAWGVTLSYLCFKPVVK